VLLRTFSKVYGLAGLRVGYALCGSDDFRVAVDQVRQPFFLNAAAQAAATEALRHQDEVERRVGQTLALRLSLEDAVRQLGLWLAESDANFLWVQLPEDAVETDVVEGLADRGVLVRAGRSLGREGALRVTGGSEPENERFVAALGHPFGPNAQRGVFRSRDGGKTWQRVLYVDDKTGAIDIQMSPAKPNVLWGGVWQAVRKPWTFESGGPGSGLYRSDDGGDTWRKVTGHGLPEGILGRIGVAPTPNPNRVYALIEAKPGSGLYRSEDAGASWSLINGSANLITRCVATHRPRKNAPYVRETLDMRFWFWMKIAAKPPLRVHGASLKRRLKMAAPQRMFCLLSKMI